MKRNLRNLFFILIPTLFIISCTDDEGGVDITEEIPLVVRFADGLETINVDDEIVFDIGMNLSKAHTSPVTVSFDIIDNTAQLGDEFELLSGNSVTIPTGETEGKIVFSSVDGNYDDGGKTFLIKITGVESNASISGTSLSYPTVKVELNPCPSITLASNKYVGEYKITLSSSPGPFGPAFEDGSIVTLVSGSNPNQRMFSAVYLPGQGVGQPPMEFIMNFGICGEIYPNSGMNSFLACSGATIFLGPSENPGTYDITGIDDSSFELVFLEFEQPACGVSTPVEVSYNFEKQ